MSHYATRVSYLTSASSASDRELNEGQSLSVHNVIVQNTTAAAVDLSFTQSTPAGDGTTVVGGITVSADDSYEWNPHAIFDKGFTVPALGAGVNVTVSWRPGV
jgi:hypothetical protein